MKFSKPIFLLVGLSCLPNMAFAAKGITYTCPDSGPGTGAIQVQYSDTRGAFTGGASQMDHGLTFERGNFDGMFFHCSYKDVHGENIILRFTGSTQGCKVSGEKDNTLSCE